jgi:putative transposase
MRIQRGYRFRLDPTPEVEALLIRFVGQARYVWNQALALNLWRLAHGVPLLWYADLCGLLRFWKTTDERQFLAEGPSQALQQRLKDLAQAFSDAFDPQQPHKRLPRFKKRYRDDTLRFPQGVTVQGNRVALPKIGWIKFFKSREIPGILKNTTITRHGRHWYVSFQTEQEVPDPVPQNPAECVGGDLGVRYFLAWSDGTLVEAPRAAYAALRHRIARLQRKAARQQKFSKNWRKTQRRIAALYAKAADIRRDFTQKLSTTVSQHHATVALEDLRISNMTASAKGTVDNPGTHVRQKAGLNRAILDLGWGMFAMQLAYKLAARGGQLIRVSAAYSSLECSQCGYTAQSNRPTRDRFVCVQCGYAKPADVKAAETIEERGRHLLGVPLRLPVG